MTGLLEEHGQGGACEEGGGWAGLLAGPLNGGQGQG